MTLVISSVVFLNHLSHSIRISEKAAAELKKRLESVDSENRILTRKSSIDTSNFPKEIVRQSSTGYGEPGYGGSRRRSSTKETDIKPERFVSQKYLERYTKSALRPTPDEICPVFSGLNYALIYISVLLSSQKLVARVRKKAKKAKKKFDV